MRYPSNGKVHHLVFRGGKTCDTAVTRVCAVLCLIPLQVNWDGNKFDFAPLWRRILYMSIGLFYVSCMFHRFGVTVSLVTQQQLNIVTFLCSASFLVSLVPLCGVSGSSWTTLEIKELLNSWNSLLTDMEEAQASGKARGFVR